MSRIPLHSQRGRPRQLHPEQVLDEEALRQLRRSRLRPVFAVAGGFVGLYMLNALLASSARDLMGGRILGALTVGLALGLLLSLVAAWTVWWYARYAATALDPLAAQLRAGHQQGSGDDSRSGEGAF